MAPMNELRRSIYLQAMGIDAYVSRRQLPGAAGTRRLAILRNVPAPLAESVSTLLETATPTRQHKPAPPSGMPRIAAGSVAPGPGITAARPVSEDLPLRFSLAAITCGGWLWVEELEGTPFTPEQLQLLQAMAGALGSRADNDDTESRGRAVARPLLTQFDWPMHTNQQLDLGQEAALASVAAFIQRKLDQRECNGLVLLGRNSEMRVPVGQLDCQQLARTVSTAEMLHNPLLKRQAWRDLRPLSPRPS